jgi:hypothetical protein
MAGFVLRIIKVAQPLGEEAAHLPIKRSRSNEYLRIACPSLALVTLRAVGGNVDKVALLAPLYIALKLVDERIGALEISRRRHFGMDYNTDKSTINYGNLVT